MNKDHNVTTFTKVEPKLPCLLTLRNFQLLVNSAVKTTVWGGSLRMLKVQNQLINKSDTKGIINSVTSI